MIANESSSVAKPDAAAEPEAASSAAPPNYWPIEMRNVWRRFGNLDAVQDVSFTVGPGEIVGFIGPNGAGKTTSMRILATLDLPTGGDAFIDGFSVTNDPDRVRRRMGFMPDNYGSYGNMNCEEYLDFFARAYGLSGQERIEALQRVIEFAHIGPLAQKPVKKLSKGMKQRLCLGRALIHDPQVIVLDEPAAGLDPRARIELREMVLRLAAEGKSVLVSSHILSELAEICRRVVIIEAGRLVAVGSVDEIMALGQQAAGGGPGLAEVVVGFLEAVDRQAADDFLGGCEHVELLETRDLLMRIRLPADPAMHAQLLRQLIESGVQLTRFAPTQRTLEEVFVQVTRGIVQ